MTQLSHIGLDVHKDTVAAAVLSPYAAGGDERVIPSTPEAIHMLVRPHQDPFAHAFLRPSSRWRSPVSLLGSTRADKVDGRVRQPRQATGTSGGCWWGRPGPVAMRRRCEGRPPVSSGLS